MALSILLTIFSLFALRCAVAKLTGSTYCQQLSKDCEYLTSPTANPFTAQNVSKLAAALDVSLYMSSFLGITELEQQFGIQGIFNFKWQMPDCTQWNDTDLNYGQCLYARNSIWHPDVRLSNGIGQEVDNPFNVGSDWISISPEGVASWLVSGQFFTSCSLAFKTFPFDKQTCNIQIVWKATYDATVFRPTYFTIGLNAFPDIAIWRLENSSVISRTNNVFGPTLIYAFTVQRKQECYFGTIPMVLLTVLQTSVYVMPADAPDRAGISITAFLSSSVLLGVVSTQIPLTPESQGLVVTFSAQIGLGVVVTIYTLFSCRFVNQWPKQAEKLLPPWNIRVIDAADSFACGLTILGYIIIYLVILVPMMENSN